MKNIISALIIILFFNFTQAQKINYNALWKQVEQFEINGLPKSALKIVNDISYQATKNNDTPQLIKTMLFKGKFALVIEEDAKLNIINDFKNQINTSQFPTKNILESLLANLYWQYFNQNRWTFYNRTKTTVKVDANDFRTWDLETLFNEIHMLYQKSLENGLMLQQDDLSQYDDILQLAKDSKIYRPTLFDFLNHQALDFYKTDETQITKPAYKFEIDNPNFLSDAKAFSTINIASKDSTSLQLHALKIYQNLIQFHLNRDTYYAIADVNIERLKFVNEHATFTNKQALLLKVFKTESKKLKLYEVSGLYDFEIASFYYEQSKKYEASKNDENRWKAKEAISICKDVISKSQKSTAAKKCNVLKTKIEQQTLQIKTEEFLPIQTNGRLLITYKNIDTLNFRILNINRIQLEELNSIYNKEEQLSIIKKLETHKTWKNILKNENDYQTHSTEITVPKLENGNYVVFSSFNKTEDSFAFSSIQITNIALVETKSDEFTYFQCIDRNNGKPIKNANVELTYKHNWKDNSKTKNHITNSFGEIKIKNSNYSNYRKVNIKVNHSDDIGYFGSYYINNYYKNEEEEKETYKAYLFTDRSIYRPGQTVYFKAIAMKTKEGKSEVLINEKTYATLINVNGEDINELELITNEFGSVSGEFILPNSGLNGQYYIKFNAKSKSLNLYTNQYFSVEEYKRPKFETKFNPVTETFKINDSVSVNGKALAYAGSNITGAKVVYRVHRKVKYPRWYYWYRPWFNSEPQEITHGETTTNYKGEFEITFTAIPDQSVDKNSLPIFNYEIIADVTDLNGETRSATSVVKVGYHALEANLSIAETLDKTKKGHKLAIDTKNLNGEFVPATGNIKIYKLKAPDRVLRSRPWKAPDYQEFSKENFNYLFPNDAYSNEDSPNNWKKGALVLDKNFDTEKSKTLDLGSIDKWVSGQYIITLESQDKFGQNVKDEIKTTLYSDKDKTLADNQLFSISTNKESYEANDKAKITLASAAEDLYVTLKIEKNHDIIKTQIIKLNNNKKTFSIPIEASDIGGFVVHYSYAAFNSFQSGSLNISVPYPKIDLDIETTTFRDKLQPGTDETWSFKIKGPHGDKVSAELLASMYDMSLDQFKKHQWNFKPINNPVYYSYNRSNAQQSFGTQNFRVYNDEISTYYPKQYYDQWNWYGFSFNFNKWKYDNYINSLKSKIESKYNDSIKKGYVTGKVIDKNDSMPLIGASVIIKGTSNGTATDFDGRFTIKATKGDILTVNYLGYIETELVVGENNYLIIQLPESDDNLEEVVVVGYGSVNKKSLKREAPPTQASPDVQVEEAIQGNSAGLKIQSPSEELGAKKNIEDEEKPNFDNIQIRKNLNETAFFFPQLQTDEEGNVSFSFTTPEALTQWKLQLLAHTKTLESATKTLTTVTQKELMVIPNAPRFLRQGDTITISTKIANLTETELSGQVYLVLTDAITGKDITAKLLNSLPSGELEGAFTASPKGNTQVSWNLSIPDDVDAVQYKIIAKAGDFSDGEQNALPVLSNRMLVTETMPMWIRSNETKTFTLSKLKYNTSTTLKNHKLTLEITSNPAWYAVQALPYLMEYPYECNEQTFSKYYANALASHIVNSNPRIQEVFNQWKSQDALVSNLEKNEELKSILIQETPWLRDAQSESEQKKRIALLFDLNKMNNEFQSALNKLKNNQLGSGAWPWFNGGHESRYITQHIITGLGHLKKLNVISTKQSDEKSLNEIINKAITYLDNEFTKEYKNITKYDAKADLNKDHLSYTQLHYLYMRSFFPEINKSQDIENIIAYYQTQIEKYWLSRSLYSKGLMALISHRNNDVKTTSKILNSLKETSITSEELGMYWKVNTNSWYWYQAPIETQALLIEAFSEAGTVIQSEAKNLEDIDNLKIWLLKNKQTNKWKTTKATTDAVYALLLQGSDWLSVTDQVDVTVGGEQIEPSELEDVKVEAGTGYYKTSWTTSEIKPEMAQVKLTKKGEGIAWGGLYWQYFEDLDKITSAETPLKLKKKLFLKTNTDLGEGITEIKDSIELKVGDLVRVRIELRSDRNMEFVHMKDMRAAGLEPTNVLSQYKWQDGLGYYESTKDASTNFFFDYLPKGIYVFEYDLRVNNAGNMSNGITTIQSMYAPEFSSHSEGVRVVIGN